MESKSMEPMTMEPSTMESGAKVAWVTGASRGIGRGVAVGLGEAGWTVWVTARSNATASTSHLPGTVEEVAAAVTAAGGHGIAVACDHTDDDQVRAVVERITVQSGSLRLLVNNVWGGYERLNAGAWEEWNAPFWEQPLQLWDAMMSGGVRAHYVASALSADLLRATPGSVVITVSQEVGSAHRDNYGVAYSVSKAADDRLAHAMAAQLGPYGVASLSLYPGLVRTEGVMQAAEHLDMTASQSPEGIGRLINAIVEDPEVMSLQGTACDATELARRYRLDILS